MKYRVHRFNIRMTKEMTCLTSIHRRKHNNSGKI